MLAKRDAFVRPGHDFGDEPTMVSGGDMRWTCKTCRCYVWVREYGDPYGDATSSPCADEAGRGWVVCQGYCRGTWEWPGSFASETQARAWAQTHTCGPAEVRVVKQPKARTDASSSSIGSATVFDAGPVGKAGSAPSEAGDGA